MDPGQGQVFLVQQDHVKNVCIEIFYLSWAIYAEIYLATSKKISLFKMMKKCQGCKGKQD